MMRQTPQESIQPIPDFIAGFDLLFTRPGSEGAVYRDELYAIQEEAKSPALIMKASGDIAADPDQLAVTAMTLVFLQSKGLYPVLVHGGGKQITQAYQEAGIESQGKVNSKRVTSLGGSLAVKVAVDGVNGQLCDAIRQYGGRATGITDGVFGASIENAAVYGRVGQVDYVNTAAILDAFGADKRPEERSIAVVSCVGNLALSPNHYLPVPLNVNGDTALVDLALGLEPKPYKVIILTSLGMVLDENGERIASLTRDETERRIVDRSIGEGMDLKAEEIFRLHDNGVHDVVITRPADVPAELFNDGAGTIIRATVDPERSRVHIPSRRINF